MKQLKRTAKSSKKGPKLSCNAQLGPLLISETIPAIQANPFYLVPSSGACQNTQGAKQYPASSSSPCRKTFLHPFLLYSQDSLNLDDINRMQSTDPFTDISLLQL